MKGGYTNMRKLKCPVCNESYSRWKLINLHIRWHEVCPNCKSKLRFTTKTNLIITLILSPILIVAAIIFGGEKFLSIPFFFYFILPVFVFGRFLTIVFAEFEKLPDKSGLFPMSRSSKYALVFIVMAPLVAVAIVIIYVGYIYYSSILPSIPKMPAYLKKATISVNSDLFSKTIFWKNSKIGTITDIIFLNDRVRIAGIRGFFSIDKNHNVLSYLKFNECLSHTDIVFTNKDAIYGFINRGNYNCDAAFFDSTGKVVWTYRGNTSVYDMTAGDIEGDGTVEFVVGFSGDSGIHLLDSNGKKKWEESDKNVWHVELVDIDSDGILEVLHTNADGEIVLRDREGKIISKTKSSPYGYLFSLVRWPSEKNKDYILFSRNNRIWIVDFNGNIIEQLDAPHATTRGHPRGIAVKFTNGQPEYFAVIVEFTLWDRSIIYIYNSKKEIVYQEIIPETCSSMTAKSSDKSALQTLFIGCKGKIWQYKKGIQ